MDLQQIIRYIPQAIRSRMDEARVRAMTANYDLGGYKRIYLVHIRKTGGTSLNHIFLNSQTGDPASLYESLALKPDHRIICGDRVYVGWNVRYINEGNYFYAFSHTPLHELDLPEGTFTVTCFRDPVKRVISHYNMLMDFQMNRIDHPCMAIEGKWLGDSFEDFLQRIPEEHLLNQLYMFSARFDASEALARVAGLSHYFFTEDFASGIDGLNKKTGLSLKPMHIRKASFSAPIPEESIGKLRGMLAREYAFLDRVRSLGKDKQRDETSAPAAE